MESVLKDIGYGLRSLLKHKTFTAIAIVTLALGIGANAAIFTVVNAVVLRPLPYHDSEKLAMLWTTKDANQEQAFSFGDYNDLKSQAQSFNALGAASPLWNFVLSGDGEPEPIQGMYVSANLFELLKVAPEKGRAFTADEDRAGGPPVVIISRALWERRLGGDPNAVGKTMSISGVTATVVGIMPAQFQFLDPAAELWMPLAQNQFASSARQVRLLSVVGRLNDGVEVSAADAELTGIAKRLESAYPDSNTGVGVRLVPLHAQVTGKVRPALLLLFGASMALPSSNTESAATSTTRRPEAATARARRAPRRRRRRRPSRRR